MSWFAKNYEKATLGGAVVLALGLAYLGWSKYSHVEEDFATSLTGAGPDNPAVKNADLIPKAMQSMKIDRTWAQAKTPSDRAVDLFTGIPLFIRNTEPEKPIDMVTAPPVHEPIENKWWIEHRLDAGFADSPTRDPDNDGFTNKEEFLGKTDPNSLKSHPPLIAKLMYVKDDSLAWVLRPSYGENGSFPFTYEDSKGRTVKTPTGQPIAPNELFFKKEPMVDRFKLLGHEIRKEVSKSTNVEREVTIVRIEDQRPNKKGDIYELPAPLGEDRKLDFKQFDRSAVMSLEAIGENGKEFTVEERTAFGIPSNSTKKDYFLKKVTPAAISVEYTDTDGQRKTIDIPKGAVAQPAP